MAAPRRTYYKLENGVVVKLRRTQCPPGYSEHKPNVRGVPTKVDALFEKEPATLLPPPEYTHVVDHMLKLEPRKELEQHNEFLENENRNLKCELEVLRKRLEDAQSVKPVEKEQTKPVVDEFAVNRLLMNPTVSQDEYFQLKQRMAGATQRIESLTDQCKAADSRYYSTIQNTEKLVKNLYSYDMHLLTVLGAFNALVAEIKGSAYLKIETQQLVGELEYKIRASEEKFAIKSIRDQYRQVEFLGFATAAAAQAKNQQIPKDN